PRPELIGSTTDSVEDTATAASKALPPSRRISRPASVASSWADATATPGGCAAGALARSAAMAGAKARIEMSNRWPIGFMHTPSLRFAWAVPSFLASRVRLVFFGCRHRWSRFRRGKGVGGVSGVGLLQAVQLGQQAFAAFRVAGVRVDALDRADHDALRFVEMADAFGAARRVDHVDGFALRDGLVRACRFADIAVDAELVDLQGHVGLAGAAAATPLRARTSRNAVAPSPARGGLAPPRGVVHLASTNT